VRKPVLRTLGMGDSQGVEVSCGRWSDEPPAEGNCASASERGRGSRRAKPGLDGQKLCKEAWGAG
jgi:hypothetical protein